MCVSSICILDLRNVFILVSYNVANMKCKKVECVLTGYEMLEKEVTKSGNSGRVYVPIEWIGKKVKIILIEP